MPVAVCLLGLRYWNFFSRMLKEGNRKLKLLGGCSNFILGDLNSSPNHYIFLERSKDPSFIKALRNTSLIRVQISFKSSVGLVCVCQDEGGICHCWNVLHDFAWDKESWRSKGQVAVVNWPKQGYTLHWGQQKTDNAGTWMFWP